MNFSKKLIIALVVITGVVLLGNSFYQTYMSDNVWDDAARSHYRRIGQ